MKYSRYLLWLAALIPVMLLRDYTPDNELRYLAIADEALRDGHLFAFFNDGEPYADKPPLYLWIVMLSRWLFGSHSMLWLGLFSLVPGFVIIEVMSRWTASALHRRFQQAAGLMLLTTAYFIGGMVVLRMDMLMAMFIVLALYTFYKMYSGQGRGHDKWLLSLYVFLALFTKGPFGVMIPVASIVVFLLLQRRIKTLGDYLGWRFWTPLLVACAVWFGCVYAEGGTDYLNNLLFNQTVNRAVDSFSHKKGFFFYFQTFGVSLAPWCVLYVGMLLAGFSKAFSFSQLERFLLTVFLTTFGMLSLISSKLEIYLLPAYPFIAYFSALILQRLDAKRWPDWLVGVPVLILLLAFPVVLVLGLKVPSLQMLDNVFVYGASLILTLSGVWAMRLIWKRKRPESMQTVAVGLLTAVFVGSFFVPNINSEIGYGNLAAKGEQLSEKYNTTRYLAYKVPRSSGMEVYLNHDVPGLDWEQLQVELQKDEPAILFLRNKVIRREADLQKLIEDKEQYTIGGYTVVVW